jgi:hypothetical protein
MAAKRKIKRKKTGGHGRYEQLPSGAAQAIASARRHGAAAMRSGDYALAEEYMRHARAIEGTLSAEDEAIEEARERAALAQARRLEKEQGF